MTWNKTTGGGNLNIYSKSGSVYTYRVNVNPDLHSPVEAYYELFDSEGFESHLLYIGDDLQQALEWCDIHDEESYTKATYI